MRFRLRHGSAIALLQDRFLLFSETEQQLTELGGSAGLLAERLSEGATRADLEAALKEAGADPAAVSDWAQRFLVSLSRLGLLEGEPAETPPSAVAKQRLAFPGRRLSIAYASDELFRRIGGAYGRVPVSEALPEAGFHLWAEDEFLFIEAGDHGAVAVEPQLAAVRLKGMILEEIVQLGNQLFALHSASLRKDASTLLLLGPPGAGKTTLALTLAERGWEFGSDDVTLVFEGGRVLGVPLAAGLKEGAWDRFLSSEALGGLPAHERPDGQRVRFLPVGQPASGLPSPVSTVVRLHRSSGQAPFVKAFAASEAVAELLAEARSPTGVCTVETFRSLVELAAGADCFELHYSDAREAADFLVERAADA